MKKAFLFSIVLILTTINAVAQSKSSIVVPDFKDQYSEFVKSLEAGNTDIDYLAFRYSFIESEQFLIASKNLSAFTKLEEQMYQQMGEADYPALIATTQKMLSIDYTSMIAHKILRQTYNILGDTINAKKYKAIQFGLLNSIVKNGDGQSCATAWPVIQVEEEYFILQMIGAKIKSQKIDQNGGICDKMIVTVDGVEKTYYFETTKVFEGYNKKGIK